MRNILVIDDKASTRDSTKLFLEKEGFFVKAVATGGEAIALIRQKIIKFAAAVVDFHLADDEKGSSVIRSLKQLDNKIQVIGFSGDDGDAPHNESLESGALMFISKDISKPKFLGILHRLCRESDRHLKLCTPLNRSANSALLQSLGMAGTSDVMSDVARRTLKFASSDGAVLIRGENGTGKEMIARAIHENSQRRRGPFIAINCGEFSAELIASELFGHEKGAFTGADSAKIGKFQAAEGGTLFLDEIGEMLTNLQVRLLRVLQEHEITPVGSNVTKKVNVRVIAATNAPLEQKIEAGLFREDLNYRLDVLRIDLPPLRERPEDIPWIVDVFMKRNSKETKVSKTISDVCIQELQKMPWPGNVRQLQNAIMRMYLMTEGPTIDEGSLAVVAPRSTISGKEVRILDLEILKSRQIYDEISLIDLAFRQSAALNEAAIRLGVTRSFLRSRIRALKISNPFSEREE